MWSVWRDGIEHRLDAVPLTAVLHLEDSLGVPIAELNPRQVGRHAAELCRVLDVETDVPLSAILPTETDVPVMWSDAAPKGGRTLDGWIVSLVRKGFTPRQIREDFTLRDLYLMVSADG